MGVTTTVDERVLVVEMNWPERRNALGPAEADELTAAMRSAWDPEIRGMVLTGNGAFCAGGDLKAIVELAAGSAEELRNTVYGTFQTMITTLIDVPVPTVAAVDGPAIGLGADLALACDARYLGGSGYLRQGWAGAGLIPGTGGVLLLQNLRPDLVWRLVVEQPTIGAVQAVDWGLAYPCEGRGARDAAHGFVSRAGNYPGATMAGYVRLARRRLREELEIHLAECLDIQVGLIRSAEFAESARRILDRR